MALIEPIKQDIEHPSRLKKFSSSIRFWHWANVIIITGSLLTVLANSTLLSRKDTAVFLQKQLQQAGAAVTAGQADSVAHDLGDRVWAVHTYFGYALAALLLFRLILELFQAADQKLIRKIGVAWRDYHQLKIERQLALHELTVKIIYIAFYLVLIIIALTGLTLAFQHQLGIARPLGHSIKELHGFCMYLVLAFIAVHLIGVYLAERKESPGIVSDMINGGRHEDVMPVENKN